MKNFKFPLTALAASVLLVSCNDDSDDSSKDNMTDNSVSKTHLRVLHASSDAPMVNVNVNGELALSNVDYAVSSDLLELDAGSYDLSVDGIIPGGNVQVINAPGQNLMQDKIYEVVATGDTAAIQAIVVARDTDFDTTKARVTLLHAADDAPEVDVHVTTPNAELNSETVFTTFSFSDSTDPAEISGGDYHVRITLKDDPTTVVYDSGVITLENGSDYFISALENPQQTNSASSKSPVMLAVSADENDADLIYSQNDGADLRVIHNVGNAPLVDIVVNDGFEAPLIEDLAFTDVEGYVTVAADTYNVKVAVADTTTDVINADVMLNNANIYSVYAVGTLDTIEALILEDNPRELATHGQIRVIHGSTLAGSVDVYVTTPGGSIDAIDPALSNIPFKADSGYIDLAAGSYDVIVTANGSKTAAIGPVTIDVTTMSNTTYLATDNAELDGVSIIGF